MDEPRDDRTDPGDGPLDGLIEKGLRFGFSKESTGSASEGDGATRASRVRLRDPLREEGDGDGATDSSAAAARGADAETLAAGALDAGRYAIGPEIARGGVGAVHRGRDRDLGRDVALKILLERHLERPELVDRFLREAQVSGQLQHPGVVPVYDVGLRPDRRPFFSMKLVQGKTLAALLDEREDPAEDRRRFLGVFEKVLDAVAYAHACGVIHRDLKPSNALAAPRDGNRGYQVGSSFGTGPIPIGWRPLGLGVDDLLVLSVSDSWPQVFAGYRGRLDASGNGQASIRLPKIGALVGQAIHSAFVTVDPSAKLGIGAISNTHALTVTP